MFDMAASSIMMRRSSSTDSNSSSTSSLSFSPKGWSPSKSTISAPTITSSPTSMIEPVREIRQMSPNLRRALSPCSSRFTMSSAQQAYISSWPVRDSLSPAASITSPTSSYFSPTYIPSSRISDDDLAALDFSKPSPVVVCQPEEAAIGLSWSAINNPTSEIVPALQICERRRRLPPPPVQYRRRSSSRRSASRKNQKPLGAIAE